MRISLFPSPVVYRECLEHPKLLDWVKEYRKTADHDSASSSCGWHSPYDLHKNEDFTIFFLWFYSELATSIAELTPSPFEVVSMWAISVNALGSTISVISTWVLISLLSCGYNLQPTAEILSLRMTVRLLDTSCSNVLHPKTKQN